MVLEKTLNAFAYLCSIMWKILTRIIRGPRPLSPLALKAFWDFSGQPLRDYLSILMGRDQFLVRQAEGAPVYMHIQPQRLVGFYLGLYLHGLRIEHIDPASGLATWRWKSLRLTVRWGNLADEAVIKQNYVDKIFGEHFEGMRILDIGAYIGDTALLFACGGAAEVYAIEPSPKNLHLLERNILQNQWRDRIHILPVALSGENGMTSFFIDDNHPDTHHMKVISSSILDLQQEWRNLREIEVPTWTLEKIIDQTGWDEVDLAKVDCEGGEYPLFLQTPAEVLRRVKVYIVEYHDGIEPLRKRLEEIGYCLKEVNLLSAPLKGGYFYAYRVN